MPTYEYKCEACGHEFEQFQSITAAAIKKCPKCKKSKVRRLIGTGAGLIFKGSGFYITDYRSEGYKNSAKSDAPASATGDNKGGESKTEGKPAAPTTDAKPAAATPAKAEPKPAAKSSSAKKKS
jgi:putative FmdB family regulatory protein